MPRPSGVPKEAVFNAGDAEWYVVARDARGRKHGPATYWRADGTLVNRCCYEHDVPHGPYERYHENGEVSRRGTFEHGALVGLEVRYRSSGPTTERAVEGLHPSIWRYEVELAGELMITGRYYGRDDGRLTVEGAPFPSERPTGVPLEASFMAATGLWFTGAVRQPTGRMEGRWRHWNKDGVLVDDAEWVGGVRVQPCCPFEPIDAVLADHDLLDESYVRRMLGRDEKRVVARCREALAGDPGAKQWLTACRVLTLLGKRDGAAELVRRWDAADGESRKRILYVLANHEDDVTSLAAVDQAVSHRLLAAIDDDALSAWAVEVCGRGWGPGVPRRFSELLAGDDRPARRLAFWLLEKAPTAEHIALVGRVAREAAPDARKDLLQSLAWVKGAWSAKAVDEIWNVVADDDPVTCPPLVVERLAGAPRPEMRAWLERLHASAAKRYLRESARIALLMLDPEPIVALHDVLVARLDGRGAEAFGYVEAVKALAKLAAGSGNRKLIETLWALAEQRAATIVGSGQEAIDASFSPEHLVRVALTVEGPLCASRRAELTERLGLTARLLQWQSAAGWEVDELDAAPPIAATLSYDACCSLAWQMRGTTREVVLAGVPGVDADVIAKTRTAPDTFLRELVWHSRGKLRLTGVRRIDDLLELRHGDEVHHVSCTHGFHGDIVDVVNRLLAEAGVADRYVVYSECDTTQAWYPEPGATWFWFVDPVLLREHVLELPLPVFAP